MLSIILESIIAICVFVILYWERKSRKIISLALIILFATIGNILYIRHATSIRENRRQKQLDRIEKNTQPKPPKELFGDMTPQPKFFWKNTVDPDGDKLVYNLQIKFNNDDFSSGLMLDVQQIQEGKENKTEFIFDMDKFGVHLIPGKYYWRVRAFDGYEYGDWSDVMEAILLLKEK